MRAAHWRAPPCSRRGRAHGPSVRAAAPRGRGDRGRGPGRPDRGADTRPLGSLGDGAGGPGAGGRSSAQPPPCGRRDHRARAASTWAPPRIECWHWRAPWAWAPSRPTTTGSNVQFLDGRRGLYPSVPGLPDEPGVNVDIPKVLALDALAAQVPVAAPWRAPRAAEWDSQTFETWKQANLTSATGKAVLDTATQAIWGAEPRDLSLLFVLFYIAAAGNERNPGSIVRLISVAGRRAGEPLYGWVAADRPAHGAEARQARDPRLAGAPDPPARRARDRGVGPGHRGGATSDRGVPPVLAAQIEFRPGLPSARAQLLQRYPAGALIKAEAIYPTPFWRASGLSGQAVTDVGPSTTTFDNSPPDGRPGVLFGFIGGRNARVWGARSAAARRRAVLDQFATLFGPRMRDAVRLRRGRLGGLRLDPRLPHRLDRSGGPVGLRAGDPQAGRAGPLGRHRDRDLLERLHGRRGALRASARPARCWQRARGRSAASRARAAGRRRSCSCGRRRCAGSPAWSAGSP